MIETMIVHHDIGTDDALWYIMQDFENQIEHAS